LRLAPLPARTAGDRARARGGGDPRRRLARRERRAAPSGRSAGAERRPLRRARALHPGPGLRGRGARRYFLTTLKWLGRRCRIDVTRSFGAVTTSFVGVDHAIACAPVGRL